MPVEARRSPSVATIAPNSWRWRRGIGSRRAGSIPCTSSLAVPGRPPTTKALAAGCGTSSLTVKLSLRCWRQSARQATPAAAQPRATTLVIGLLDLGKIRPAQPDGCRSIAEATARLRSFHQPASPQPKPRDQRKLSQRVDQKQGAGQGRRGCAQWSARLDRRADWSHSDAC